MIVDSSALVAVIFQEPDAEEFALALSGPESVRMSAVTLVETTMVIEGTGLPELGSQLDELIRRLNIEVLPVSIEQAEVARRAWRTYGKGRHPAGLNFGDCFTYALAATTGEPLLFKGEDFALTDLETA